MHELAMTVAGGCRAVRVVAFHVMRRVTIADDLVAGTTLVVVHNPDPPAPTEWTLHCEGIAERRAEIRGVVVLAHGPGPNARQRHELAEAWAGTPPPVAVMTRSTIVRGVLTALNWFMANRLEPFSEYDFAGAFAYVRVPEGQRAHVLASMRKLAAALGVTVAAERKSPNAPPT